MSVTGLERTAQALVAGGRGLLAADETVVTVTRRLGAHAIESTPDSRRTYRELFLSAPGAAAAISGVCLHDETIRQHSSRGIPFPHLLARQSIVAGIRIDRGARSWVPLASGEDAGEGFDGLGDRLGAYVVLGARFAKWRVSIAVGDRRPTATRIRDSAQVLARFAAICHQRGIVPILAPEVMTDGEHTLERCEEVTASALLAVFRELADYRIHLEAVVLTTNMVAAGTTCADQASPEAVGDATLRCLRRHVPAAVPGIAFFSGGHDPLLATTYLNTIAQLSGSTPWALTFAFGRALQDEALTAWGGWPDGVEAGQRAFLHRARLLSAAVRGQYLPEMELQSGVA
jgi:fructose-bisphosphate aldolase class I